MNTKQQTRNRHILQEQSMDAHAQPLPVKGELLESFLILSEFLSVAETDELHRQLKGGNRAYKINVLTHWYDMVQARRELLDLDSQCREMRKPKNWLNGWPPLADRLNAVVECQKLGMVVEREGWVMDVIAVYIV